MPPIPGEWIVTGGPVGLLALAVFMIFVGWLVPRPAVRRLEDTVKRLERERDQWQAVALKAMGHADALLPAADIASQVMQSFTDQTTAAIEGRETA